MGPLPDIDHGLRIVLTGGIGNHPWASVQHALFSGTAPDSTALTTLATSISTSWQNSIAVCVAAHVKLTGVQVTDLTTDTSSQGFATVNIPGTHTETVDAPSSACWVQSLKINERYRGGHPRIYWPYTDASALAGQSTFNDTIFALLDTAATGWISDINNLLLNGVKLQHGAARYFTHDPVTKVRMYRSDPHIAPTVSTSVHKRLDTQRRRLGAEVP